MKLVRHSSEDAALQEILELIQTTYAFMSSRIDPPSSMNLLGVDAIADQCRFGEVWSIGQPPQGCVFLTFKEDALYLGKIAVSESVRKRGVARELVALAERRARSSGLKYLELKVRMELIENHKAFRSLGFFEISQGSHSGYDRPTFIVMRKIVAEHDAS